MFKHTLKPNVAKVEENCHHLYLQQSVTKDGALLYRKIKIAGSSKTLEQLDATLTKEELTDRAGPESSHQVYRDRIVSWHKRDDTEVVNVWGTKAMFQRAGLLGADKE